MNLFEPELALIKEVTGEFTLHSVTLVPNACWQAETGAKATPSGQTLRTGQQGVILPVMYRDAAPCVPLTHAVNHSIPQVGGSGVVEIVAFVVDNRGTLKGMSSASFQPMFTATVTAAPVGEPITMEDATDAVLQPLRNRAVPLSTTLGDAVGRSHDRLALYQSSVASNIHHKGYQISPGVIPNDEGDTLDDVRQVVLDKAVKA